ncbi:hypothetical protein [Paenibacillus chitinolyticus]|uniref:hypothetical protein n=1 Tax=Paenibacillus chitinolyticus TaxID=79263 RepID=UPI003663871B
MNVELESHKQALSVMTENSKFEYQRRMHDFSLYRTKKHDVYPVLYKKFIVPFNEIQEIYLNWDWPFFDNIEDEFLDNFMLRNGIEEDKRKELIEEWKQSSNVNNIKHEIKFTKLTSCHSNFKEAYNFFSRT